jgi:hypothetical protein
LLGSEDGKLYAPFIIPLLYPLRNIYITELLIRNIIINPIIIYVFPSQYRDNNASENTKPYYTNLKEYIKKLNHATVASSTDEIVQTILKKF